MGSCGNCKHNPEGYCKLCGKEIPTSYVMGRNKTFPRFCPLNGENKK